MTHSSKVFADRLQYLIDNHENEDRQLVSWAVSLVEYMATMSDQNDSGQNNKACEVPEEEEEVSMLYDMIKNVSKELGPKDIFDSAFYHFKTTSESIMVAVIASKTDVFPRSLVIQFQDPFQHREYIIQTVSDGVFYDNIAKIKASHDKSKEKTNEPNAAVRYALENIFSKVKGSPTNTSFSFRVTERIEGKANSHQYKGVQQVF